MGLNGAPARTRSVLGFKNPAITYGRAEPQPGFLLLGLRNYKIRWELLKVATSQSDVTHVISFG